MAGTCEDALGALSARLGIPLEFRDGTCEVAIGGQPFWAAISIRCSRKIDTFTVSLSHNTRRYRIVMPAVVP